MALLRRLGAAAHEVARLSTDTAALAAVPVLVGAGLVGGTATRAVSGSLHVAKRAAVSGTRAVGTLVTGSDPLPNGHLHDLLDAARGMVEPPAARHTRRVWRDRDHLQIEFAADDGTPGATQSLRRHLERLEGVEWATVNDVVGRVLVAVDARRVGIEDVVGVVTDIEQARGGRSVFPQRPDHPADLEPLLAALAAAAVDTAAVGVAAVGKVLPIPALTRHATLLMALLDTQRWLKRAVTDRIGPVGTELAFEGTGALLHSLTQSPTVPALNAAAAIQRALEVRARRQVWRRRERELCRPEPDDDAEPLALPGPRPGEFPKGPVETYRARLDPTELAAALGLLALTRRPGRSADFMKALTPKAAVLGRESFAATLGLLLSRRGVLPMDGSAFRRLDRVDTVVVDGAALCTGPPVVAEATAEADGWDDAAVWTAATRLLTGSGDDGVRLGPPRTTDDVPGGEVRSLLSGRRRVGTVTVAAELDPHAEALLSAATDAGLHLVLSRHVGTAEIAGLADDVAPAGEPLVETVRQLQEDGHGVLLVSAVDGHALLAADIAVAPVLDGRAPAWGADLITSSGLADACLVVAAAADARATRQASARPEAVSKKHLTLPRKREG
ncbi:HAD family hydrolase [Blastococcus atacamensis]|uniref:hypothetical protein n=1 Tax=Blastococcus atacamensis TaxID=2070508 RepID=UPI001E2A1BA1|nr:hypothetical protein [Blastococcus atacamensis]